MREKVSLICSECKRKNYFSTRNKKVKKEKIEMNKYCSFCRKHILHKEGKP
ncbi:MAG: 50S ribosomal protein L33 [Elusimicrobia bacterium]|nr:50S ribosomal protein L33 [Elusimicrobiota bacterium]